MRYPLLTAALLGAAAISLSAMSLRAHGAVDGQTLANHVCAACHGKRGNSTNPDVPSIAGQGSPYLQKQLRAFKTQQREGVMGGIAMGLNDEEIRTLATYFSSQIPRWNPQRSMLAHTPTRGAAIYDTGIADQHVPACASCHAMHGEGLPPEFPRLAGQHASYIAAQLRAFRTGGRISNPNAMMRNISAKLSDADIQAVADYIQYMH